MSVREPMMQVKKWGLSYFIIFCEACMTHKKPKDKPLSPRGEAIMELTRQDKIDLLERQLAAARYVAHSLIVHKYATYVASVRMTLEDAHGAYEEAMRNYDGIVDGAKRGASAEANDRATAKGADAINEMLEQFNGR